MPFKIVENGDKMINALEFGHLQKFKSNKTCAGSLILVQN